MQTRYHPLMHLIEQTRTMWSSATRSSLLTCNQECGAVGPKLVPEGGEEVDELEHLGACHTAGQGAPQRSRQQEQYEISQKSNCLHALTAR